MAPIPGFTYGARPRLEAIIVPLFRIALDSVIYHPQFFIPLSGSVGTMGCVSMSILIVLLTAWLAVSVGFALCAGRVISTADRKEYASRDRGDNLEISRF